MCGINSCVGEHRPLTSMAWMGVVDERIRPKDILPGTFAACCAVSTAHSNS